MCFCITRLIFSLQEGHLTHDSNLGLFQPILCSTLGRLHELLNLGGQGREERICYTKVWRSLESLEQNWSSVCSSSNVTAAAPCESMHGLQSEILSSTSEPRLHQFQWGNTADHSLSKQTPQTYQTLRRRGHCRVESHRWQIGGKMQDTI